MADAMANMTGTEIAVIGMSGRFPGAKNINEFWENLKNGIESVFFLSDEELKNLDVPPHWLQNPTYVKSMEGLLEDKEFFDGSFFGYTPKEAEIMDPQMRVFFECVWSALEDAGYDPGKYDGFIGLYAGAGASTYWEYIASLSGTFKSFGYFASNVLMNKDFVCTQISYKLNLKGPSFTVQTACSTSLVAIHLACQGILNGECNMALAGGIKLYHQKQKGYIYEEGLINSPDSHCRAFDARAKGTINGEGSAVVLLKLLEEAIADGDHIYAVIKGTAINNDGFRKIGYTAPSIEGQAEAIRMAHQMAEIAPETIGYIETHGTGTELGDPVEIEGLKLAFNTDKKNFCGIGSVKTNIGHLDAAAGVAGFIKTALALQHQLIPPSLHFESPNPRIDFENSPFYVNNRLSEWKSNGYPRRAGVSSFGLGGTNAHVVLEEWPDAQSAGPEAPGAVSRPFQLILLSANTEAALERTTRNLANHFQKNSAINLSDAAYTLMVGRKNCEYKRMLVCENLDNAIEALSDPDSPKVRTFFAKEEEKQIIFMFSGQGSQYVNMGLGLYKNEPAFREEVDRCFHILETEMGYNIKDFLYPDEAGSGLSHEDAKKKMDDVFYSGPIKFTIEYALAKLLMKWGIKPYALIGHSFGEYAVAHLAGVFSLEDALRLVVLRGKLMEKTPAGAMMGIPLPAEELKPLLKNNISLAAINTPSHCIVSGPREAVEAFEKELHEKGHECLLLNFPRASHSTLMKIILEEFAENVGKAKLSAPKIPYIAGLTGDWISPAEATDPHYWGRHMVETIQFSKGIKKLLENPDVIFVQVSCDSGLPLFVSKHLEEKSENLRINLLRSPKENTADLYYLLNALGLLWLNGANIDGAAFYGNEKRCRIPLPTYPFEKKYYWLDEVESALQSGMARAFRKNDFHHWFYVPSWTRTTRLNKNVIQNHNNQDQDIWLFFIDDFNLGANLVQQLQQNINLKEMILVRVGENFARLENNIYTINPQHKDDYHSLLNELNQLKRIPRKIVHLWGITGITENPVYQLDMDSAAGARAKGFYSLLFLTQAIAQLEKNSDYEITVVTNNIQDVTGNETVLPAQSPLLGTVLVIPQEHRNINCRNIDISFPTSGNWDEGDCAYHLMLELLRSFPEKFTAHRNGNRWLPAFQQTRFADNPDSTVNIKENGTYLLTGGLDEVGFILAEYLAKTYKAKLVLAEQSQLPGKNQWDNWLSNHDSRDPISEKIKKVRVLEEYGSEVFVFKGDTAIIEKMQHVIEEVEKQLGPIAGIIHAAGGTQGPSSGLISQLNGDRCEYLFKTKADGLMVLEKLFKDRKLDFRVIISSILSFLGGLENAAYSAADIFMDTFARQVDRWISIDLDIVDINNDNEVEIALSPEEFINAFELILKNMEAGQIIVSTSDLYERIERSTKLEIHKKTAEPGQEDGAARKRSLSLSPRPNLSSNFVMAVSETEKKIVGIWRELLGYEEIGLNDNFFELGGNSLAAIEVKKRLKEAFNMEIPVVKILHFPTIHSFVENFLEKDDSLDNEPAPQENQEEIQEELIEILDKF